MCGSNLRQAQQLNCITSKSPAKLTPRSNPSIVPTPPRTTPATALGNPAEIVKETGPALPAHERAVERGHGASDGRNRHRSPRCAAPAQTGSRGPGRAPLPWAAGTAEMSAAVSIPLERAHREPVEGDGEARIAHGRPRQRAHRSLVRLEHIDPAHQHVEQPFARTAAPRPCRRRRRQAPFDRSPSCGRRGSRSLSQTSCAVPESRRSPRSRQSRSPRSASRQAAQGRLR